MNAVCINIQEILHQKQPSLLDFAHLKEPL